MRGKQTLWVLRAAFATGRYTGVGLALGALLASCAVDPLPYGQLSSNGGEPGGPDTVIDPVQPNHPAPSAKDAGSQGGVDAGLPLHRPPPVGGGCVDGATMPCGPESVTGTCKLGTRACHDGIWGECEDAVMPADRDCSSPLDNDCDGYPDNTVDDYCHCVPGMAPEACDTHPGFDGNGPCHAGTRTCELSADKRTSEWSQCTGSVAPVPNDSCTQKGDDSNCNGKSNDTCACVEGDQVPCGPKQALGICKIGTQTCVNGKYGDCVGAVYPNARDCTSTIDNDCDGKADNTIDTVCTCAVNKVQACGTHPQDGIGICKAGTQTCLAGAGNKTSAFNACTGSVPPKARDCTSAADNDCNGVIDSTIDTVCACAIGTVTACETHPGDGKGICHAGQALCIAGANNSSSSLAACSGSVGPLAADSCTVAGDDSNCDGVVNGGCECVVSTSCPSAAAARCSAGKCVACTSNADCTHIPGLGVCSLGSCVECTATSAAACTVDEVCDPVTSSCVAVVPPPPPPPAAAETP